MNLIKKAGLTEINYSTGDEHLKFVPFEYIANAAHAAVKHGLRVSIAVEGQEKSAFTLNDALLHPTIMKICADKKHNKLFEIMNNVWIPFRENVVIEHDNALERTLDNTDRFNGCDSILTKIAIDPFENLLACCGLTCTYIKEMNLGNLRVKGMKEIYYDNTSDVIKMWLRIDGPEKILKFVSEKNSSYDFPRKNVHSCQVCAAVFNDPQVVKTVNLHAAEVISDIIFRYNVKNEITKMQCVKRNSVV